jgi:methionyl-tRNA formyltransferase
MKLLLLIKPTSWCNIVKKYVEKNISDNLVLTADWGDPKPDALYQWEGDYIISFLSPWILPQEILDNAKIAAINFHPGPPKYPGIGGYNFAIYDGVKEYGATCHHMLRKVDSGQIIAVKKFLMDEDESVESLKEKTMVALTDLFYEIIKKILNNEELPKTSEKWERMAYTRKDFQDLCKLDFDISEKEAAKRLKATYFPGALDYPNIEIAGKRYLLVNPEEFESLRKKLKD